MQQSDTRLLLEEMQNLGAAQAENSRDENFGRWFLPIPSHLKALKPDVSIIIGERGAGKSELFRGITTPRILKAIYEQLPHLELPANDEGLVKICHAHPLGKDFPDKRALRNESRDADEWEDIWFAYLLRVFKDEEIIKDNNSALKALFDCDGGDLPKVLSAFRALDNPVLILDRLDNELKASQKWIFVCYDELDVLTGTDWGAMYLGVRGLVSFWASYWRRWERIRPKIFLRTDVFRSSSRGGGSDFAKLAATRVELNWNDVQLYGMLAKRLVNAGENLQQYCMKKSLKLFQNENPVLGWIPFLNDAEDFRPLIERILGVYMGAGEKKGQCFTWILNHLRDGNSNIVPRSLIRLFEKAAQRERDKPKARFPHLLDPVALRMALEDVSLDHVTNAFESHRGDDAEWAWMFGLQKRLEVKEYRLVPWYEDDILEAFKIYLKKGKNWGRNKEFLVRPPVDTPEELLKYLKEIGVFKERGKGQVDVPDIYLFGLGLKRKGGVRRT